MASGLDVLQQIADQRRQRVEVMKAQRPAYVLREQLPSAPPNGRLERALRRPAGEPLRLICEVKRASPSKGPLKPDADPVEFSRVYAAGGASAISLVTEPDHFRGDLDWINIVRPVVKLPLLLKDFVVDSYQLLDAAHRRADGVLLLAPLLSEVQLQRLIQEAVLLGLDPLVEVHTAAELNAAVRAGATLLGINNRNLHTFEVDTRNVSELLPLVPPLVTVVAESGISAPEQITELVASRCDAALIGEAFMTSADPAATLAALQSAARG